VQVARKTPMPGPPAYLTCIAGRVAWRLWWLPLTAAATAAYGLAADWRWTVVALMLLLLIYPAAMTLTVLRYATSARVIQRARAAAIDLGEDYSATLRDADGAVVATLPPPEYISRGSRRLVLQYSSTPDDILLVPLDP